MRIGESEPLEKARNKYLVFGGGKQSQLVVTAMKAGLASVALDRN